MNVLLDPSMANEVVVTRKDQTTIPVSLRRRYGIREGTHLEIQDIDEHILLNARPLNIGAGGKRLEICHASWGGEAPR